MKEKCVKKNIRKTKRKMLYLFQRNSIPFFLVVETLYIGRPLYIYVGITCIMIQS